MTISRKIGILVFELWLFWVVFDCIRVGNDEVGLVWLKSNQ